MAIWRVTMSCLVLGQVCQNVVHVDDLAQNILGLTICTKFEAQWLPNITPFQHTSALWTRIEARVVSPVGLAPTIKTINIPGAGSSLQDADNSMLARQLQFRTTVSGKHGRGRLYIPGASIVGFTQGLVKQQSLQAGLPLCQALMNGFCIDPPGSELALVIARKNDASQTLRVSSIVQATTARMLRRRQLGVGI